MFRRGGWFLGLVGIILLLGLLAAGGYWLFQAGQAQGYALGIAAAAPAAPGAETAPGNPAAPGVYPGYPGWMLYGRPHFGFFPAPFFGLFCLGAIFFFFLFAVVGPLRWRYWGHHPGYWYGGKGGPGPWGPPPWAREQQPAPGEGSPGEGSPGQGSQSAG